MSAARDLRSEFSARIVEASLFLRIERTQRAEKVTPRRTDSPKQIPRDHSRREETRNCRKRAFAWGRKMIVCSLFFGIRLASVGALIPLLRSGDLKN